MVRDIVTAIESIKKLEYAYLYEEFANFNMYPNMTDYSNIVLKILLADMKNLNVFYGNGLQFIFLLIEEAIFIDELMWENANLKEVDANCNNDALSDNIAGLSMYYKLKRFASESKYFFINKVLEFDDNDALRFIYNIVRILGYEGNIKELSNSIYAILIEDIEDYYKAYNIMNTLNSLVSADE